jgi:hypothetical protein
MLDGFRLTRTHLSSQRIDRAFDTSTALIQDVRVDHRGPHVFMSKKFLHSTDIVTAFQEVRGKGMVERVTGGPKAVQ